MMEDQTISPAARREALRHVLLDQVNLTKNGIEEGFETCPKVQWILKELDKVHAEDPAGNPGFNPALPDITEIETAEQPLAYFESIIRCAIHMFNMQEPVGDCVIRKIMRAQKEELSALMVHCFRAINAYSDETWEMIFEMPDRPYFGMFEGEKLCGFVGFHIEKDIASMVDLGVHADARQRGFGTALMRHAERAARSIGLQSIGLMVRESNAIARRLYAREGYTQIDFHHDGCRNPVENALELRKMFVVRE